MTTSEPLRGEVARHGWHCPGCQVNYSPDVAECRCQTTAPSLAARLGRPSGRTLTIAAPRPLPIAEASFR